MIELRKKIEKNHSDKHAEEVIKKNYINFHFGYGSASCGKIVGIPFRFIEEKIKKLISDKKGEMIRFLDYGCGMGVHSIFPAKCGAKVYGIDISEKLLEIAKEWAKRERIEERTEFLRMDCERTEFPDNFFDIVFNCGTLACLDRKKAYPEVARVLKPDGYFISIDTLGHNPLLNLNRKIKLVRGLKTQHTVSNILKMSDVEAAKQYFKKTEMHFYHLFDLAAVPFQKFLGCGIIDFLERVDKILLKIPFLRKYSFKVIFIFAEPKK